MAFVTEFQNVEIQRFDNVSTQMKLKTAPRRTELLDYFITPVFPRQEFIDGFSFVYGLFELESNAFSINQSDLIKIANQMFQGSVPLTEFENLTLSETFRKSIKRVPSLPGRI
jgi:hypothetical protein